MRKFVQMNINLIINVIKKWLDQMQNTDDNKIEAIEIRFKNI